MANYTVSDVPAILCRTESSAHLDGSTSGLVPSLSGITPRAGGSVQVSGANYVVSFTVYDSGTKTFSTNTVTIPSIGPLYGPGTPPDLCRIVDLSSVGLGSRAIIWHAGSIGIYLPGPPGWATNNGMRRIPLLQNSDTTILNGGTLFIPDSGANGDGAIVPAPPTSFASNIWGAPIWGSVSGVLGGAATGGSLKVYKVTYAAGVGAKSLKATYTMDVHDPTTWTQVITSPGWLSGGEYYDEIICEQTTTFAASPDVVSDASVSWEDVGSVPYAYTISPWVEAGYGDAYQGSVPDHLLEYTVATCLDLPDADIAPQDFGPRPPFYPPLLPWPPVSPVPNVLTVTVPANPTLSGRIVTNAFGADPYVFVSVRIEVYVPQVKAPIASYGYNLAGTTSAAVVHQFPGLGSGDLTIRAYYVFGYPNGGVGFYGWDLPQYVTV